MDSLLIAYQQYSYHFPQYQLKKAYGVITKKPGAYRAFEIKL